ncbi:uncharacterized protein LOC130991838 [Salvia miltiorrhiza]|uniref:uncharacterized protein LOC130991838 n=1 Tax=Salvia miltiorrhiza TaxID=226208 RepID=UPI0025AD6BC9|nr:uncharacterized protein LOC130991838 [Salvia miltiorrhiza]
MAPPSKTHQLLEINIISAQDLQLVSKSMKTYAMAWMNPKRKLTSRVDDEGRNNPTWNEKFVFRVEEDFLKQDTSAVMIEIYSNNWFRDVLVGTVRCLVGNLIPQTSRSHNGQPYIGMRFVALQIRRPSGRPQGILNIGVALLDSSMRSMPLYTQPAMSAVGYHDLMEDPDTIPEYYGNGPMLRRIRSERSEATGFGNFSPSSSMIIVKGKIEAKESSILSITECMVPVESIKKVGKASSVICGAELRDHERTRPMSKRGKASSVVSDSMTSSKDAGFLKKAESPSAKLVDVKQLAKIYDANDAAAADKPQASTAAKPQKPNGGDKDPAAPQQQYVIGAMKKGNQAWSDSEVGPSPSEVAAVMAERRYPLDDKESSVLDGWSMDESVEGLRSKLERWRMELPPLYDNGGAGDFSSSSYKSSTRSGKADKEKDGSFSCFGNIFGYECQCICGKPADGKKRRSTSPDSSPDKSSIF